MHLKVASETEETQFLLPNPHQEHLPPNLAELVELDLALTIDLLDSLPVRYNQKL